MTHPRCSNAPSPPCRIPTGGGVKATIVLVKNRGYEPSDERHELQEHVKAVTAPYKYPRIIQFVDELPRDHQRQNPA